VAALFAVDAEGVGRALNADCALATDCAATADCAFATDCALSADSCGGCTFCGGCGKGGSRANGRARSQPWEGDHLQGWELLGTPLRFSVIRMPHLGRRDLTDPVVHLTTNPATTHCLG
jgi:hypothetical protein